MEENYFSNLLNTGVEYAEKQIGPNGIIQLSRPYSISQHPGNFRPGSLWGNTGLYSNPNPMSPQEWSKYDLTSGSQEDWAPEDRMNYLQHAQSSALKIGNSLVNNLVIAGTTAISDILTIPIGLITTATGGNFIENPINRWAADALKYTSEQLPIYRGSDYEDKNLLGKMGTNVFWADLILNLGFTEGMVASSLALSYLKLPSVAISLISAIGEGSIEAINRKDEVLREQLNALDQSFQKMIPDAIKSGTVDELSQQYSTTKDLMEKDAIKSQNLIFAGNIALLTLTNQIEFGRYLSKGYDTERRFFKNAMRQASRNGSRKAAVESGENILEESIMPNTFKEITKGLAIARGVGYGLLNAGTEAFEETSQDVLLKWPTMFEDFNHFNSSQFNPEKKQLASDLWDAMTLSVVLTFNDPLTAVDAMTGFITGLIGMPHRQMTSSGSKKLTWMGGLAGALQESFSARKDTNAVISQINEFIQNDKQTKEFYHALVRDLVLLDELNLALEQDDKKTYKDAEHGRVINEALLYSFIGKTDELKQQISSYLNMSDEELQLIANEIANKTEDNSYSIDDLKESIKKRAEHLYQKIDFVDRTKKDLLSKNPLLSDDSLKSLIFLESQIADWESRANELTDLAFEYYKKLISQEDLLSSNPNDVSKISYVKKGKFFHDDMRDIRLYEPGEPIVSYYIDENGRRRKHNNIVVKKKDNGNYVEIKDYSSIKENDGTIYVVNKDALYKSDIPGEYIYTSPRVDKMMFYLWVNGSSDYREDLKEAAQDPSSGLTITETDNFIAQLDDLHDINTSLENFYKQRNETYKEIQKQNEVEALKEVEVAKEVTTRKQRKIEKDVSEALTVAELREKLKAQRLDELQRKDLIDKLEKKGNEAARRLKQLDAYKNSLLGEITKLAQNDEYLKYAKSLINSGYYSSDSIEQFANPQGSWLNNTEYFKDKTTGDPYVAYQIASYLVQQAMVNINSQEEYRAQFADAYRLMTLKNPFTALPHAPASVIYVNDEILKTEHGDIVKSSHDVESVSSETIEKEIDEQDKEQILPPEKPRKTVSGKQSVRYYRPAIPQFSKEQVEDRDFLHTFAEYMKTTGKGDFDALYDYLVQNHTFDYINEGNIHEGDEIGFMIDPTLKVNDKPVILMIHGERRQVVGSLNNDSTTTEYIGLSKVIEFIYNEYNSQLTEENKDNKFYSLLHTNVSLIMNGNIAYSEELRTLDSSKDNGVKYVTRDKEGNPILPILGIVKNRRINTNGKVEDSDIVNNSRISRYNGRVVLLIPTSTGKYFAVPLRTKHLNENEFNLSIENPIIRSRGVGRQLIESFTKLAKATSYNTFIDVIPLIGRDLYIGGVHFNLLDSRNKRIENNSDQEFHQIQLVREIRDDDGFKLGSNRKEQVEYIHFYAEPQEGDDFAKPIRLSEEQILENIINAFMKLNLLILININELNTGQYNTQIIEQDLLTTNLERGDIVNTWFTTNYFNESKNKFESAVNPSLPEFWKQRVIDELFNFVDGLIIDSGTVITLSDGKTYIYDRDTFEIRDKEFNLITDSVDETTKSILRDLDFIYREYGDVQESNISHKGIYKLSDQFGFRYFDINSKQYVTDEKIKVQVEKALKDKEGLISGVKKLHDDISHDLTLIHYDEDEQAMIVDDGDEQVVVTEAMEYLPKQYTGKSLTQSQMDALYGKKTKDGRFYKTDRSVARGFMFYTLDNFSSVDALLNGETIEAKDGSQKTLTGMRDFVRSKLEYYGIDVTEDMLPTEDNWDSEQYKEDVLDLIKESMLESLGSENSPIAIANAKFKKFLSDYFNDFFNKTHNLVYSVENDYGMNEQLFNGFKQRLDNFVRDRLKYGSQIVGADVNLFHRYDNKDVYTHIDLIVVDSNGKVSLIKIILDDSSWLTEGKNGTNIHFKKNENNPNLQFSDEERVSKELLTAKSIFEAQYGIEVEHVGLMPFTIKIDKKTGLINFIDSDDTGKKGYKVIIEASEVNKSENIKLKHVKYDLEDELFTTNDTLRKNVFFSIISQPVVTRVVELKLEDDVNPVELQSYEPEELPEDEIPDITGEETDNGGVQEETEYDESFDSDDPLGLGNLFAAADDDGKPRLLSKSLPNENKIDIKHEIDVITKFIPQLSDKSKTKIVDALIRMNNGLLAMGKFKDSMITISNLATEGTYYHEAFHFVFNALFSPSERVSILDLAADQFGAIGAYNLEEALADEFMHYVQYKNDRGLLAKIKAFFEDMLNCIRCWFGAYPNIRYIFYQINRGKYANREVKDFYDNRAKYAIYSDAKLNNILDIITAKNGDEIILSDKTDLYNGVRLTVIDDAVWFTTTKDTRLFGNISMKLFSLNDIKNDTLYLRNFHSLFPRTKDTRGGIDGSNYDLNSNTNVRYLLPIVQYELFNELQNVATNFVLEGHLDNTSSANKMFKKFVEDILEQFNYSIYDINSEKDLRNLFDDIIKNILYGYYGIDSSKLKIESAPVLTTIAKEYLDNKFKYRNFGEYLDNNEETFGKLTNIFFTTDFKIKGKVSDLAQILKDVNSLDNNPFEDVNYLFDRLPSDIKQSLLQKGWTLQMFDSMSEDERQQAIMCLGI